MLFITMQLNFEMIYFEPHKIVIHNVNLTERTMELLEWIWCLDIDWYW